ncbi:MAG: hypothetical protein JWQ29_1041 [Phenylobacterium sp.]|nr:hypothetical protein [Phenylobacterium sp.]
MPRVALLTLMILSASGPARAEDFIAPACRPTVPLASVQFETPLQARWYRRFWSGDCNHLSGCFSGSPNWNAILDKLLARGGAAERPALLPEACRLGQTVGLEWTREKTVRRISTNDLRDLYRVLEGSGDPLRGVERVDAMVRARLAGR